MKIALFGNTSSDRDPQFEKYIFSVCEAIKRYPIHLYLPDILFYSLSPDIQDKIRPLCILFDVTPQVDMAMSVGGDGTFLRTASIISDMEIPILGINTGRLGFLADINCDELDDTLREIVGNKYRIEERILLEIDTNDEPNPFGSICALNEVAILKQDTASMLSIHAYINGEYLTSYRADGLVIATPTGSTAYSLSIGGPILVPTSPSIILAAIAPHSLTARPLVVGDDSRISLKIESRSKHYLVSLDGQSQIFNEHTLIEVYKAPYTQKVVKRLNHTFFKTLRDKLMWGADLRK